MENNLLSKSQIADKLGTNPMRVSRYIEHKKINAVKKLGKRELYNLTDFNALKIKLKQVKANSSAETHSFNKDEYILTLNSQLKEQKEQFEQLIASKNKTISNLEKTYDDLQKQLSIKDKQIASLTTLTKNAQTLNLLDKPKLPEKVQADDTEQPETNKKRHWWHIFTN